MMSTDSGWAKNWLPIEFVMFSLRCDVAGDGTRESVDTLASSHLLLVQESLLTFHHGPIEGAGDGLYTLFSDSDGALAAANVLRRKVWAYNVRPNQPGLDVRIAVSVHTEWDDYGCSLCGSAFQEAGVALSPRARDFVAGRLAAAAETTPITPSEGGDSEPIPTSLVNRRTTPFSGRTNEIKELTACWNRVQGGNREVIAVGGEPGVGKSRLVDYFATTTKAAGAIVLSGRCDDHSLIPNQPFAEALGRHIVSTSHDDLRVQLGVNTPEVARLVPVLRDKFPRLPAVQKPEEAERLVLFQGVGELIANASTERPVLLVLEDLHWASSATIALLSYLHGDARYARLLIVVTYRTREPDGTTESSSPLSLLSRTFSDLRQRYGRLTLLDLSGFNETEVEKVVRTTVGQQTSAFCAALAELTAGIPLAVNYALDQLGRGAPTGGLEARELLEVFSEDHEGRGTAYEAVKAQLASQPSQTLDVLRRASLLGRVFSVDLLEELDSSASRDLTLDRVESACRAGLVLEMPGAIGQFAFSHALVQKALYDSVGLTRRARLHLRAADAIERRIQTGEGDWLVELARHLSRCDVSSRETRNRALDACARAGDFALGQLAFDEAAELYERAAAFVVPDGAASMTTRCELLLRAGEAYLKSGEESDSQRCFREACDVARQLASGPLFANAATGLAGPVELRSDPGFTAELVQLLEEALTLLEPHDLRYRPKVLGRWAVERFSQCSQATGPEQSGESVTAEDIIKVLDESREAGDASATAWSLLARLMVWNSDDDVEFRLRLAEEFLRNSLEATHDPLLIGWARGWVIIHSLEIGRLQAASDQLDALESLAHGTDRAYLRWAPKALAVTRFLMDGQLERAEDLAWEAWSLRPNTYNSDSFRNAQLVLIRREQGRLAEIEPIVRSYADGVASPLTWRAALALLCTELGRPEDARREFAACLDHEFRDFPCDPTWMVSMAICAETCNALEAHGPAAQLYELLVPHEDRNVVVTLAAGYLGSVQRYLGLLQATIAHAKGDEVAWQQAEVHFTSAIERDGRMGATMWVLRAQVDLAALLTKRGGADDRSRVNEVLSDVPAQAEARGMTVVADRARRVLALAGAN